MSEEEREQWRGRAIAALNMLFPSVRRQGWEQWEPCSRLLPHVLSVTASTTPQAHSLELASLLTRAADYLSQRAQYEQAEPLYQRALAIRSQRRGTQHLETADSLHGLARLHELRNQPEQALELYQQALRIREQHLGSAHPNTLKSRACYAHLLRLCGRLEEAAALETASS